MKTASDTPLEPTDAQKRRHGLSRMWHAFGYSMEGLRAGWGEAAGLFAREVMPALRAARIPVTEALRAT